MCREAYAPYSLKNVGISFEFKDESLVVKNRNMKRYCVEGEHQGAKITIRTLTC